MILKYSTSLKLAAFASAAALLSFSAPVQAQVFAVKNAAIIDTGLEDPRDVVEITCNINTARNQIRERTYVNYYQTHFRESNFVDEGYGNGKWIFDNIQRCKADAQSYCFNGPLRPDVVTVTGNLFPTPFVVNCRR